MKRTFFLTFNRCPKLLIPICALFMLAACDNEAEIAAAQQAALVGNKIECALNGSDSFLLICATERVVTDNGTILMIRHSDGGFQRFRILTDGRGLEVAEGFDDSRIEIIDEDYIILSSGNDKYKLKAQFTSSARTSNALPPVAGAQDEASPARDVSSENPESILADSEVGPIGTPGAPYPIPN